MQEVQLYIEGQRVDLFKDETISLTSTIQNVRDIAKVFTDFSQQFNLPATKTNNKIFKHYYNPDLLNSFDARFKVSALIKINGADFRKGFVRLNSVSLKDNVPNSYKVVFFGETVTLSDLLGEARLDNLELSAYDHNYNLTVVKNGLQTGLGENGITSTNRDIVYPLIFHTKNFVYDNTGFHEINLTNGVAFSDLKPAIKLKHIITAIEAKYPTIKFSNDFFGSNLFNELYLWLHREKGLVSAGVDTQSRTFSNPDFFIGSPSFPLIIQSTWNGLFFISHDITYNITSATPSTGLYNIEITDKSNGSILYARSGIAGDSTHALPRLRTQTFKNWELDVKITTSAGINSFIITANRKEYHSSSYYQEGTLVSDTNYQTANSPETIVGNIKLKDQIPKVKIIDFLTDIFKTFNLTAYVKNDVINVKPLDDFYSEGIDYDITKYTDITSSDVDRVLPFREIAFKFSEPKTFLTIKSNATTSGFEFGNLSYDAGLSLDGGKYDVKANFEKVQFQRLSNLNTKALTEIQSGWIVDDKQEPTIGSPIIFFNINRSCSTTPVRMSDNSTLTTYNAPSNVRQNGLNTINFGAEVGEYTGIINYNSLFEKFYKNYIESVFDIKARLLKLKAFLPLKILLNYNLSDRFVINGKRYKINSIKTNLQTSESDLELITELERLGEVIVEDTTPPTVPTGLAISSVTQTSFLTTWNASTDDSGILRYDIFLNGLFYDSTTNLSFSIAGLTPSTNYNVRVKAIDNANNESALTSPVNTTTLAVAPTAPTIPTGLAVTQPTHLNTWLNISWNASTDDVEVEGYRLWRKVNASSYDLIATLGGNVLSYIDKSNSYGNICCYKVEAFDIVPNYSGLSAEACREISNVPD